MAYNQININPLDLKPSTGVGVAIPFSTPGVFTTVYTTQEQLKYNIINYLLTSPGERVFVPNFGLGLRKQLFEQMSDQTAANLESAIRSGVEANFPTVTVVKVKVTPYYDENILNISFSYSVNSTGQEDEVSLNFQNG